LARPWRRGWRTHSIERSPLRGVDASSASPGTRFLNRYPIPTTKQRVASEQLKIPESEVDARLQQVEAACKGIG
jgi:hypothetical protein